MVTKRIKKIQLGECIKENFYGSLDDFMWDSIDSIFTFDGTTLHDEWTEISLTEAYPVRLIITLIDEEYNMRNIIKLFMFNSNDESIFVATGHQEITDNNETQYDIIDDKDLSRILDDYIAVIKDYEESFMWVK
jgi:hypothetical protein|nr:MAG TPA: hypothetical protein [Caudoviricetes sp.]